MSNYKSYFFKSLGLKEESLPGGVGDNTSPSQVDQEQLKMGIEVEREHTKDDALATEIALDHLSEDPQYYSNLKNAGLSAELPASTNGETLPMVPQMSKLMSPVSPTIKSPQVIAVGIRGTRSGGLPAGGYVEDPEKSRLGGWQELKVLPQGGVKGDPEKARFGGLERVKNLKPNSQGAISDTPASDEIKAKGGHFTPDNGEITRGEAPKTNKKGSDAIHPMQVQQLGNEPLDDDGTTRNGKETPAAAEAGIEGSEAPESAEVEQPKSQLSGRGAIDTPNEPGDNFSKFEKEKGPWGIELDGEEESPDGEESDDKDVAIDIKETCGASSNMRNECDDCGCGSPNMIHRFQTLANIKGKDGKLGNASAVAELKELVGRLNAKGKVTPILAKAQKYLRELESSEIGQRASESQDGNVEAMVKDMVKNRTPNDDSNTVADQIVLKLEDMGLKNIQHQYDNVLSLVTKYWK